MKLQVSEEDYEIFLATKGDLPKVLDLLVNAATWLQTKSTSQWDYYLTDLEGNTPEILDSIINESTYLVTKGEYVVASVTLEDTPNDWDRDIWGEDSEDEQVVYLHRLVVHRDFAGKGLGKRVLEWAEGFVKEKGIHRMRFDCVASNKGLNDYYQKKYPVKEIVNIYGQHSKYEILL